MRAVITYSCKHQFAKKIVQSKSGTTIAEGYPMRAYKAADGSLHCSALCRSCYEAKKVADMESVS